MLPTTSLVCLYGATLLCLFAAQGSSFAQQRNAENSPDAEFQKTDRLSERLGRRQLCTDETCRSILSLLGSRKSCFSTCLRAGDMDAHDKPSSPPALAASEALAECVYARCFQGNENRIRKETIADCISGPCVTDESTEKEPKEEEDDEEEDEEEEDKEEDKEVAEAEAKILRALRSQYMPRSLSKRGYSDATDICIQFHCANLSRATLAYVKCIRENRCNGR